MTRTASATAAGLALALGLMAGGAARAHSPYLLPNQFDLSGHDHVTVVGSLTEHFFTPDIALKSDGYAAVGPDGARTPLQPVYTRDMAVLELPLAGEGTWRVTTGARGGRPGRVARVDGRWVPVRPDAPAPAGAPTADVVTEAVSEAYVSRGKPNAAALAPTGRGLEVHALTHPDGVNAGEPARFELLLDGRPAPGVAVDLHRGDELYAEGAPPAGAVTDAAGRFSLTPPAPGLYVASARMRTDPVGDAPARNLSYSLTFEAGR